MRPNHLLRLSCLIALPALCLGQAKKQPLTRTEILGRLAVGTSPSSIARFVKLRGVNFSPGSYYLAVISRAGGNGILYKRLSATNPDDSASTLPGEEPPFARLAKCAELGKLGDFKTAETECRAAISENPASPWPLLATLRAFHHEQEQPPDMEELARRATALGPNLPEAHHYLATAVLETSKAPSYGQEYSSEIERAAALTEDASADDELFRLPADSGLVPGGFSDSDLHSGSEAEARIERQLNLDPDFAPIHALASSFYEGLSQPERAFQEMSKALELEPDNAEFHVAMAGLFAFRSDTDSEITELREAIRCEPFSTTHRIYIGERFLGMGRMENSLKEFDEAIAIKPANWEVNNEVTDTLAQHDMLAAAIADIRKFLTATADGKVEGNLPNSPEFMRFERQEYLARLLQANGQLDEAAAEFSDILRTHADDASIHNDYGNVLLAQNKVDEAAVEYREALRFAPEMSVAHNNLALCMARKNQFDGAIGEFRSALDANPKEPHSRAYLGFAYASKGDFATAIAELNKAIGENPKNAEPHSFLGRTYLLKKEEAPAIAEFGNALELEPDNPETENEVAWLYATAANLSLRDARAALQHATHAVSLLEKMPQAPEQEMGAFLDTLAEAQLLNGHAAEALATEEKAVKLAPKNVELQGRIQRFRDAAASASAANRASSPR
jgi:tetratricopeptide (TPR) repeat protein